MPYRSLSSERFDRNVVTSGEKVDLVIFEVSGS